MAQSSSCKIWQTVGKDQKRYYWCRKEGVGESTRRLSLESYKRKCLEEGTQDVTSIRRPRAPKNDDGPPPPPPCAEGGLRRGQRSEKAEIVRSMLAQLASSPSFKQTYSCDASNLLGQGHFGAVFLGGRHKDALPVAIKVALGSSGTRALQNEHFFLRHVQQRQPSGKSNRKSSSASASSNRVVRPLDFVTVSDSCSVLVIQFVHGTDLRQLSLEQAAAAPRCKQQFFLPPRLLKTVAKQALAALCQVHARGVLHRDVKPQNFLFRKSDGSVFLMDFGLSKFHCEVEDRREADLKPTNAGTVKYSSHRMQLKQFRSYRDDLEALGYTLLAISGFKLPWRHCKAVGERENIAARKITFLRNVPHKPTWARPWFELVSSLNFGQTLNSKQSASLLKHF